MQQFIRYCLCGAEWHGTIPDNLVDRFDAQWQRVHGPTAICVAGEVHGPTDAVTCRRARAKAERKGGGE